MPPESDTVIAHDAPLPRLRPSLPRAASIPIALTVFSVVLIGIGEVLSPGYASAQNMLQLLKLSSFLGIIAVGQTLVILAGGIDLSVAWVLTGAAFAFTTVSQGQASRIVPAILAALAVGAGSGLVNGVGVAKLRISPIVMTLAMNSIMQGATLVVTSGSPLGVPDLVRTVATGSFGPLPIMALLWAIVTVTVVAAVGSTSGGRRLLSVGENPRASFLSGIDNDAVAIVAYTLSGISAAVAGVLFAGFSATSFLGMGDQFVLPSIAAVVLGGTSILGGRGGYGGTVLGVIFITLLSTDLLMGNIAPGLRNIIFGLALIAAILSHRLLLRGEQE
ncbi:MAG: ABC transporter permease [Rhodospirillales bacterium]|nr:ABC transporter permease [Rhodospirillales bacterium]